MSADAYLIRHDNKSMFDIGVYYGPSTLVEVFVSRDCVAITLPPVERLAADLVRCMKGGNWRMSPGETFDHYARQFAERVVRFADGHPVDCYHEEVAWKTGYTVTDTRYVDAWPYYDVFRLLPQRLRVAIQRGKLKHFDYCSYLKVLSPEGRQRFLEELPFAGKSPLVALAEVAPRKKAGRRR